MFLNAVRNGFVGLDDALYLSNPSVTRGLTLSSIQFALTSVSTLYWHPIAWLSHELDSELFGLNPAGRHLTSIALHAFTTGLVFLLLRRVCLAITESAPHARLDSEPAVLPAAAAGALFWAVHPLRAESVAWIAERKDVLCALFFVAALLSWFRFVERQSLPRYLAWSCLGAFALMSKPTAVCLVPILLLLDEWLGIAEPQRLSLNAPG